MTTDSPGSKDILWEFSEELIQGKNPKVSDYRNYFKNRKKQTELMKDLIACKMAFLIAHPDLNKKEDSESLENLINMLKFLSKRRSHESNKN